MDATCDCGRVIQQPPTGRRRRKCRVCSPPDKRDRRLKVVTDPLPASTAVPDPEPRPIGPGPMFAATLLELRAAGRHETPEGLATLRLAQVIDVGGGTAQGLVAAVREFHATKAKALVGAEGGADVIEGIFGTDGG